MADEKASVIDKFMRKLGYSKPAPKSDIRKYFIEKSSRAWPTDGVYSGSRHVMGVIKPIYNPVVLVNAVETVSVLSTVVSKIVNECTKNGYDFEPLFTMRCLECDAEYDNEVEECSCGSKLLHRPDDRQLINIKKLLRHPNNDCGGNVVKTFMDIIKDAIYYNKSIDDYYIEIVAAPNGTPVELWSLPAEDMRIFGDVTVKRFKDSDVQKFCKICYSSKKYYLVDKFYEDDREICPDCGRKLDVTSYVQLAPGGENIIARWADDEVIHGNSRNYGNSMYGNPPVISVLNAAMILNWMEIYQRDAYSQNKAPDGILTFPGWQTEDLLEMQDKLEQHKMLHPGDKKMIWLPTQEPVSFVQTMPKLVDMDAVQMAQYLRETIAIRYGVSLNMLGVQTPGKLGNETETVEVSYGTIEETQTQIAETINAKLLPMFPEIRDWKFVFNPPKKDDEMRKAELIASYANTISTLRSTGIDAAFNDNWEIDIRGAQPPPKEPQEQSPFGGFGGFSQPAQQQPTADAFGNQEETRNEFSDDVRNMFKTKGKRTYIKSPSEAPKGVNVQRGERGGYYYESTPGGSEEQPPENKLSERVIDMISSVEPEEPYSGDVYHGSPNKNLGVLKPDVENRQYDNGTSQLGAFVSPDPKISEHYAGDGGVVYRARIELKKPFPISAELFYYLQDVTHDKDGNAISPDKWAERLEELKEEGKLIRKTLEKNGFDGVIVRSSNGNIREISSFNEITLIKSITIMREVEGKTDKALSPRDIAPKDAVDLIRSLEDEFLKDIMAEYEKGIGEIVKTAKIRGITQKQLEGDVQEYTEKFLEKALVRSQEFAQAAYKLGMDAELSKLGVERTGRFTQIDENALKFLETEQHSVFNSIRTFQQDSINEFRQIISEAYAVPGEFDLDKMVKRMEEATGGDAAKLERIARSETTKISNFGRAKQWEQYADPNAKEFYWSIAQDNRVSDICRAIANGGEAKLWGKPKIFPGNPYTLEELRYYTSDFLPHPNCRSTVVRRPKL